METGKRKFESEDDHGRHAKQRKAMRDVLVQLSELEEVPNEILIRIALAISVADVANLCATNQRLSRLCRDTSLFKLMYHGDFPVESDDLTLSKTTIELTTDKRNKSSIINDYFAKAFRSVVPPGIKEQGVNQKIWYAFFPMLDNFGEEITVDKWEEARTKPYFNFADLPYVAPLVFAQFQRGWSFDFNGYHMGSLQIPPKNFRQGIRMIVLLIDDPKVRANSKQSDVVKLMDITFGPPSIRPENPMKWHFFRDGTELQFMAGDEHSGWFKFSAFYAADYRKKMSHNDLAAYKINYENRLKLFSPAESRIAYPLKTAIGASIDPACALEMKTESYLIDRKTGEAVCSHKYASATLVKALEYGDKKLIRDCAEAGCEYLRLIRAQFE